MCDRIIFNNGNEVQTIKEFQEVFKVDAKQYDWDGNEDFINCCMCELDLERFFNDHPQYRFYYDAGDWYEHTLN